MNLLTGVALLLPMSAKYKSEQNHIIKWRSSHGSDPIRAHYDRKHDFLSFTIYEASPQHSAKQSLKYQNYNYTTSKLLYEKVAGACVYTDSPIWFCAQGDCCRWGVCTGVYVATCERQLLTQGWTSIPVKESEDNVIQWWSLICVK